MSPESPELNDLLRRSPNLLNVFQALLTFNSSNHLNLFECY